ncbi:methyl-accepting chemotaxis protein, partial [Pseudophaeobacter sp.]|uniref:methyl-accepting chemotaxis protein n=1 Tax=Pseudophaeobacter sp. TaxID=1971739 RepID=UPI003297199B
EIKSLIEDSSKQVERGVTLVGKAGDALTSIVSRVNEISDSVTEIASGATEQATGLGEINTGVVQLDRVTQQNAAMVEEATAAGHMLHADAAKMANLVSQFSISGTAPAKPAPTAATAQQSMADTSEPAIEEEHQEPRLKTGSDGWQDF